MILKNQCIFFINRGVECINKSVVEVVVDWVQVIFYIIFILVVIEDVIGLFIMLFKK